MVNSNFTQKDLWLIDLGPLSYTACNYRACCNSAACGMMHYIALLGQSDMHSWQNARYCSALSGWQTGAKYLDIHLLPALVLLAAGSTADTHHQPAVLALHLLSDRVEFSHAHPPEL